MPDITNRDDLEREYGRVLGRLLKKRGNQIFAALGDPPNVENITPEIWEELGAEMAAGLLPLSERTFVQAATTLMAQAPMSVEWALVNQRAADWARGYLFDLVKGITETDRGALQSAISNYFEFGQTMGDLTRKLEQIYSPVRAEMIAVTEVTRAASEGEQAIAKELAQSGIEMVPVWQTNNDELVCELCGPKHGNVIDDGVFPPEHPRCRCWVNYELPRKND